VRPSAASIETAITKEEAARLATRAAATASEAAIKFGGTVSDSALTAKIKSKMALDDHVEARGIDVHTSGTIVTLTGVVRSADEHDRAVRLARDTEGVTKVVDKLRIRKS
jgi:hyperosmotically inducible protein